jgi:hypothetical protein
MREGASVTATGCLEIVSGSTATREPAALETLDVGWFDVQAPPPLSLGRVNHRQLERALAHHRDPFLPSEFD